MGCPHSKPIQPAPIQLPATVKCPQCNVIYDSTVIQNIGAELYEHITTAHAPGAQDTVTCKVCDEEVQAQDLFDHIVDTHNYGPNTGMVNEPVITQSVVRTQASAPVPNNMPKPGDKVLCKWGDWQFFDSTVISFDSAKLEYYIEWDDQDPSGRHIKVQHLAVNKPPPADDIGIGTTCLFHQGRYCANASVGRLSGVRWHQGKITDIKTDARGVKLYSGHHTKTADDGKWVTYKDYNFKFYDYKLDELRCSPNVFDVIAQGGDGGGGDECDVYLSYCPSDSKQDVVKKICTSHTDMDTMNTMTDPIQIKADLEKLGFKVLSNIRDNHNELDLNRIVTSIKHCKVFVSCISDEYANNENCRMEMQYAKKTAHKSLIPIIVGDGGWGWQASVVGMLIAGERYIDFKNKAAYGEKFEDLETQITNLSGDPEGAGTTDVVATDDTADKSKDVFISYCWTNSYDAKQANQVPSLSGNEFNDPRKLKEMLEENYKVWLDIEQLTSGNASGMFEQITEGLLNSKVVCAFVSTEYARSENCKMEFQFATKSLKKPCIPICVGNDMEWEATVIGALVHGAAYDVINLQSVDSAGGLAAQLQQIKSKINEICDIKVEEGAGDAPPSYDTVIKKRAPQVGDHVVSFHQRHAYFMATILSFDREEMTYYIEWDDGDSTGRNPQYNQVAVDVEPDEDDLGIGQNVFFPQGGYGGSVGNNTGGCRYHEGIIDNIDIRDGVRYYSGYHAKGDDDGKWVTYKDYNYTFSNMTTKEIRIAPNAMDALFAG